MGRPRKYLTIEEILDLVLPLIQKRTEVQVPSFNQWASKVRDEIRVNPRVQMKEGRWREWTTSGTTTSEETAD